MTMQEPPIHDAPKVYQAGPFDLKYPEWDRAACFIENVSLPSFEEIAHQQDILLLAVAGLHQIASSSAFQVFSRERQKAVKAQLKSARLQLSKLRMQKQALFKKCSLHSLRQLKELCKLTSTSLPDWNHRYSRITTDHSSLGPAAPYIKTVTWENRKTEQKISIVTRFGSGARYFIL